MPITSPWAADLRPASFGGYPFQVRRDEATMGRRVVTHLYPFRDRPYLEDLGAAPKCYSFDGFLTGDDVLAQRRAFENLLNQPGAKLLVHPAKGAFYALLTSASFLEHSERGRVIEVRLTFAVADDRNSASLYPMTGRNTVAQTLLQSANLSTTTTLGFIDVIGDYVSRGVAVVNSIIDTVLQFVGQVFSVIAGPLAIVASICGLVSVFNGYNINFGRYDSGNVMQPSSTLLALSQVTSLPDRVNAATAALLSAATANHALVARQTAAAMAADPTSRAFGQGLHDAVETARLGIGNVSDQIASLIVLAGYTATAHPVGGGAISAGMIAATAATAALCRRMALCALSSATAVYNPTSSQDAQAVLDAILPLFDAEIAAAADANDLAGFTQLRATRTAISNDLQTRGSQLPELTEFHFSSSMPSMVAAYRIYQDSNRRDDIVARANPVNALFLPTDFQALSA